MSESKTCGVCGYEWHMVGHTISCSARADRGISPAQLREKVEALEAKYQGICEHGDELEKRLDAALKRIELLERDMNDVHPNALSGDKP